MTKTETAICFAMLAGFVLAAIFCEADPAGLFVYFWD